MSELRVGRKSPKFRSEFSRFDNWLTFSCFSLLIIGTVLVYAATKNWFASQGLDPQYYLKRHIINILIGALLSFGTTLIDYRSLRSNVYIIYSLGILGLIAVVIPGLGSTVNGARSWITLPLGFQLQPAEIAKISIIIAMSMILSESKKLDNTIHDRDVMYSLLVAGLPILLIILQPDLGEVLIVVSSVIAIIAVSGARARWIVALLLIGILGSVVAVKGGFIHTYQLKRLQSFVNPSADPQQSGYQLRQSRITIGSGGVFGKGLFKGPQTNGRFVPEQQTDFIFTVAGEETGFIGCAFILMLFMIFFARAFLIAKHASDLFGRLICVGVIAWFAFQMFQNIGMAVGLMPLTGVPLPFVSYGGSSMFANLIGLGLLQNVYMRSRPN